MEIIQNIGNLENIDIDVFNEKVRAILVNDNNEILVVNYGGVMLLPGGSIDDAELPIDALRRELKEEIGIDYNYSELEEFLTYKDYQVKYPTRSGILKNRLITTRYFVGKYKGISLEDRILTDNEKSTKFEVMLVRLDEIEDKVFENITDNPRAVYFQKELLTVVNEYLKNNKSVSR